MLPSVVVVATAGPLAVVVESLDAVVGDIGNSPVVVVVVVVNPHVCRRGTLEIGVELEIIGGNLKVGWDRPLRSGPRHTVITRLKVIKLSIYNQRNTKKDI